MTEGGRTALSEPDVLKSIEARELLGRELDPRLERAKRTFEGGDYDTAVHQGLKAVEIAVRAAGGFGDDDIGLGLMNKAFAEDKPLADPSALPAEQQGVASLFRGAVAAYRNPTSHRDVEFEDPAEAAEVIILANLLLRISDRATARIANP